jgi:uncharacterized SAM-binding protein YcdF (DUF218 family)
LTPWNVIALLAVLGVGISFLSLRWGRTLLITATAFFAVAGWTPVGSALLGALEERFPPAQISGPVAGIVLLGGAIDTHVTGERGQVALNEGGERLTSIAELSRRFPEARILLSSGASHILPTGTASESAAGRKLLINLSRFVWHGQRTLGVIERTR